MMIQVIGYATHTLRADPLSEMNIIGEYAVRDEDQSWLRRCVE